MRPHGAGFLSHVNDWRPEPRIGTLQFVATSRESTIILLTKLLTFSPNAVCLSVIVSIGRLAVLLQSSILIAQFLIFTEWRFHGFSTSGSLPVRVVLETFIGSQTFKEQRWVVSLARYHKQWEFGKGNGCAFIVCPPRQPPRSITWLSRIYPTPNMEDTHDNIIYFKKIRNFW